MPGNATVGQFVVGDGTLVGQAQLDTTVVVGKPKLTLLGKAFTANVFTDYKQMLAGKPQLLLKAKQVDVLGGSTVNPGKCKLLLQGKSFVLIDTEYIHAGKPKLTLKGKPFAYNASAIEVLGKPKLILNGKFAHAGEVVLVVSPPVSVNLTPAVPVGVNLVAAVTQTVDLVPTIEEFR